MVSSEVEELVRIIIETENTDEAKKKIEETYDVAHKGMQQAKKDAEETQPKIEKFLDRWKYELLLVGGAAGALFKVFKSAPSVQASVDAVTSSVGALVSELFLASHFDTLSFTISEIGFDLAEGAGEGAASELFSVLSDILILEFGSRIIFKKSFIGAILGLFGLSKDGTVLPGLKTALKTGGGGIAGGIIGGILTGLAVGNIAINLMDELGISQKIEDLGDDVRSFVQENVPQWMLEIWDIITTPFMTGAEQFFDLTRGKWDEIFSDWEDRISGGLDAIGSLWYRAGELLSGGSFTDDVVSLSSKPSSRIDTSSFFNQSTTSSTDASRNTYYIQLPSGSSFNVSDLLSKNLQNISRMTKL